MRRRRRRRTALIKSNNPHLAGGEKDIKTWFSCACPGFDVFTPVELIFFSSLTSGQNTGRTSHHQNALEPHDSSFFGQSQESLWISLNTFGSSTSFSATFFLDFLPFGKLR